MRISSRSRVVATVGLLAFLSLSATSVAPAAASPAAASPSPASARALGARVASPATIPPPQDDPFYQPPAGYQKTAPGTILRWRPVQVAVFGILPQAVQAWQILFRTTNLDGLPMASVTTVLRPAGAAPQAIVSYQIAEDASAPQCAPSYELRTGVDPGAAVNQAELLLIDAVVGDGFAVSIPDYEGYVGDFGAARQPGYVVLDGLRAAEQFKPLGLPGASAPAALWGYSGGSLASGWAAQLQPTYAPKLKLVGAAVGGFVALPESTVEAINGGPFAGLLPSVLPGVLRSDPALAAILDKYLNATGKAALATGASQCETTNTLQYAFANLDNYLTIPLSTLVAMPAVQQAVATLDLGGSTPTTPLFVYQAVNDEVVPIAGVTSTVAGYCAHGDSVTYTEDELSEHATLAAFAAPSALSWLAARLDGGPVPHGCTTTTVLSMALTWSGLTALPGFLLADLLGLLNEPGGIGIF